MNLTRRGFGQTLLAGAASAAIPRPAEANGLAGMLWDYTQSYIDILDERRRKAYDAVQTPADLAGLRERARQAMTEAWGPLPAERTELRPRQTGVVERDDYVIEKIIFESRPDFFVTANLYRPKQVSGKLPAVVVPCGHSDTGKAGETYQRFCILLARHGFIALIYDPVGQGGASSSSMRPRGRRSWVREPASIGRWVIRAGSSAST